MMTVLVANSDSTMACMPDSVLASTLWNYECLFFFRYETEGKESGGREGEGSVSCYYLPAARLIQNQDGALAQKRTAEAEKLSLPLGQEVLFHLHIKYIRREFF